MSADTCVDEVDPVETATSLTHRRLVVALVLSAVARTNTILKEGVLPLNENPAIRSLAALGARMVRVADSSRSVLGRTFVIDVGTGEYAPDDGRGGAPLDGTRFILYAVDSTARSVVLTSSRWGCTTRLG